MRAPRSPLHLALLAVAAAAAAACDRSPYRTAVVDTRIAGAPSAAPGDESTAPALRFAVASIESPRDTYSAYTRLFDRMGQMLGLPVELEQRRTYREVNDLLISGRLDAALLCTGGYLDLERRAPGAVEIVAVPVLFGAESYRAVVIVPASSEAGDVRELRGKRFAYTDELSFSGRAWAERLLRDRGLDPERFFGSIAYTRSHDRSIHAVANGLVDGASVHGGVLAQMEERDPSLSRRVRVIHRSPPAGAMPIVVSTRLPAAARARLREVLLRLHEDPDGAASLELLRFDRFAEPAPHLYAGAARLLEDR
jgi:phosphonate transport system substrate-binding protein